MKSNSSEKLTPQTEEDIEQIIWVDKTDLNILLEKTYPNIIEVIKAYISN